MGKQVAGLSFFMVFCIMVLLFGCMTSEIRYTAVKIDSISDADEYLIYNGTESIEDVWAIWSRENRVSVVSSSEVRVGKRSLRIEYPDVEPRGYQDWSLENSRRLVDVEPGEEWTASAWVKYEDTERIGLEIKALAGGETVGSWLSGFAAAYGTGGWKLLQASAVIPPGSDQIRVRLSGSGRTQAWIDNVRLRKGEAERMVPAKPEVKGWAFDREERVAEKLDRGVFARPLENDDVYVSWRLLKKDPDDIVFDIYRTTGHGEQKKLNKSPISKTTDFLDETADLSKENTYMVQPVIAGQEHKSFAVSANPEIKPYVSIKLDRKETTFQKVGVGDLNGDGQYDFVIKTPDTNVDPYHRYWKPGKTTYKLEAYLSDGTLLWRKDLGWNIESGIWYSPYLVYDFDGDGRAEVAVKTGPMDEDHRDPEPDEHGLYAAGRVTSGPEYVSVLDGMTGKEQARANWPSRTGLGSYNHTSRNLMGVAHLDGKTPCLVVARGTYTVNKLDTYQYRNGKLEELWKWNSTDEPGGFYYGQGDHFMHTVDVIGDDRDEIVLGSAVIGSNGNGMWSSGMGHVDNVWVGNIDPTRPGMEIYLGVEGGRVKGSIQNGISLWDAATGELLWGLERPTSHVHSSGLVSNIDSRYVGMEAYSGESAYPDRWLHTGQGKRIADETKFDVGLAPRTVYWDSTPERELLVKKRIFKYPNQTISSDIEGNQAAWIDLFGDWREEIITSIPGELRIYMTRIPAKDRRVALIQDPLYRSGAAHLSMGYGQPPLTSYYLGRPELLSSQ